MTIWKFAFKVDDEVAIEMPTDARIIHVETQNGIPCMWAIVDPKAALSTYKFRIFGTGQPLPDRTHTYIGTFQTHGGRFVWHVFRDPK